jgi:hypothetical protein
MVEARTVADVTPPPEPLIYPMLILCRFHVTMYGALLCFDASILFLVRNYHSSLTTTIQAKEETSSEPDAADLVRFISYALWTASVSLAIAVAAMTSIALLNRPLDPPKTLVINSRLLRLAPRLPATIVIICLPLIPNMNGSMWCAGTVCLLYAVFLWEWFGGLEKDWKLVEQKCE